MPRKKKAWVLHTSSIHSTGMFAARDIEKEEKIIEYIGERVSKEESLERCLKQEAEGKETGGAMVFVFDVNEEFDLDGNVPNNPAKYINHSCDDNCEAVNEDDRIFIYSKKAIKEGEELVFDYGYDIECYEDHPCRCGSKKCVGYIVAKSQRKELKRRLKEKAEKAKKKAAKKTKKATKSKKSAKKSKVK